MLIRVRQDLSFRSRGPVGLPSPRSSAASSTFPGIYMRPNGSDDGSIPAGDPFCASPDIWIAGEDPVPSFQTTLAAASSYSSASSDNVYSGQGNFIYVRGLNGASSAKSVTVNLYYAPSGVIQSPSQWQNNSIPTDVGQQQGSISNLAPGTVGVCGSTFMWSDPPLPPPGSDHYCLFAQFNDASNSNPFPNPETVFDMGSLIMNNLGWGWRNTSMIPSTPGWQCSEPLAIPVNYPAQSYSIVVTPTGWIGWDVDFHCSEPDSNGNVISLQRTTIKQDGVILGVSKAKLDPGWQGQMFINLYSPDGRGPPPGATIPLSCNYVGTTPADFAEALDRGLVDWNFQRRLMRFCPEIAVGPTAWIVQGTYSTTVTNNPSAASFWRARGLKLDERM